MARAPLYLANMRSVFHAALAVGVMEAVALGMISAPFRASLPLTERLAWDSASGLAGTMALALSLLAFGLLPEFLRRNLPKLLPVGAIFLAVVFVFEILIERVFLTLGLGPVTSPINGMFADALSVAAASAVFLALHDLFFKTQRIGLASALNIAFCISAYEALFVGWQLGALPKLLELLGVSALGFFIIGWFMGGFLSALLAISLWHAPCFFKK